jgi:hypothetical protein
MPCRLSQWRRGVDECTPTAARRSHRPSRDDGYRRTPPPSVLAGQFGGTAPGVSRSAHCYTLRGPWLPRIARGSRPSQRHQRMAIHEAAGIIGRIGPKSTVYFGAIVAAGREGLAGGRHGFCSTASMCRNPADRHGMMERLYTALYASGDQVCPGPSLLARGRRRDDYRVGDSGGHTPIADAREVDARARERGRSIHRRDSLFAELFRYAERIEASHEPTVGGVRVIETSKDPCEGLPRELLKFESGGSSLVVLYDR